MTGRVRIGIILERFLEVFMTKDLLQVPHEYHRDSGTHTRFGLIVGAGAAGLAYAKALRQRPGQEAAGRMVDELC